MFLWQSSRPRRTLPLAKLGKFKLGKSCLYLNRLSDVDIPTLRALIEQSVAHMIATNP